MKFQWNEIKVQNEMSRNSEISTIRSTEEIFFSDVIKNILPRDSRNEIKVRWEVIVA